MLSFLKMLLWPMFAPPLCPWTQQPCPHPDKCGFHAFGTVCLRDSIERGR